MNGGYMLGVVSPSSSPPTVSYDDRHPVEVAPGVFHLGVPDARHGWANVPYLVVEEGRGALIDPGSAIPDFFAVVRRKLEAVIDPKRVELMIVQHQDPDLCAALPLFEPLVSPEAEILCPMEAALLVQHYGLHRPLTTVEDGEARRLGDRVLRFFMTPYVHFVGAMMTYDDRTKTLFSSDLFGGFSESDQVFASPHYDELSATFMGQYLGSRRALEYALERVGDISVRAGVDRLCPQHGCVIDGPDIPRYVELAHQLEVGGEVDRLAARNRIHLSWKEVQEARRPGRLLASEARELVEGLVAFCPRDSRDRLRDAVARAGFAFDDGGALLDPPGDLGQAMLDLYASLSAFPSAKVAIKRFLAERGVPF